MKKNILSTGILLTIFAFISSAQNVGINTTGVAPDAGAGLDVNYTNKGVLIPRVNIADLTTIAPVVGSSTESMLVYNTNATTGTGYHYWDGARWVRLETSAWRTTGNAGTNATNNFLGTTDLNALRIRTNNANRFEFTTDGRLRSFNGGSAGAPTYSWTADSDVGMYRITTNTLGFSTTGAERMRIDENGSVGIGTTTPFVSPIGGVNVQRLHVSSNTTPVGSGMSEFINSSANGTAIGVANTNTGNNQAALEGTSRGPGTGVRGLHIPNAGNGIGVSGESNSVNGIGVRGISPGAAGFFDFDVVAGDYWNLSDKRLKSDILPIERSLSKILSLDVYSYFMNQEIIPNSPSRRKNGFMAQEVQQIFPELVSSRNLPFSSNSASYNNGANYKEVLTVNYVEFIPILTKAIQEQQEIIESQNERIERLEAQMQELLNK